MRAQAEKSQSPKQSARPDPVPHPKTHPQPARCQDGRQSQPTLSRTADSRFARNFAPVLTPTSRNPNKAKIL